MSKSAMVVVVLVVLLIVIGGSMGLYAISVANQEVSARNALLAKQRDNESEYDALWKKIEQSAQVTEDQKQALLEIFRAHAAARGGGSGGNAIVNWLAESVPQVETATYRNLQNIIAGSRDRFAMRQRELLDLKRRHDVLMETFPGGNILAALGRQRLEVTVITSARSASVFKSGRDENLKLPTTKRE